MTKPLNIQNANYFSETPFGHLMQRRIHKVLLICSGYDAFMLDEDGRIDEQIFNEYVSLNLRYPPQFIHVETSEEALVVLENEPIDLVITMLSIGGMDPFSMAKKVKESYESIPIVVLTPFSREVSVRMSREDTSAIDYVFCWLGNADIMLAIIKLIEDEMNVEHDVEEVGVQTILLVEDSVRFYSSYLPLIYRIILTQAKKFMDEGLNEHQKMMRMRGRPKILLARTYEEAIELYESYEENLLGIISDVSYNKGGVKDTEAGLKLARHVKGRNKYMPFLLQSSNRNLEAEAKELRVAFLYKHSSSLLRRLKHFINKYLAFGDFVFVDPKSGKEVGRVSNLKELQDKIYKIPDESLFYHFQRDHVSKWLNARALFSVAEVIKYLKVEDFTDLEATKRFVFDTIANFRYSKGRGIIAKFYREKFDEYLTFTRIGDGTIGGKARGLAFLNLLIKKYNAFYAMDNVVVTIPRTVVLSTDVFEEFMEVNELYPTALSEIADEEILDAFVKAHLPERIHGDLLKFVSVIEGPIAVRSSSVLEDSHYQPFAGIYSTYMIANSDEEELMLEQLCNAIKCVYASAFYNSSKRYMEATMNVIDEERMGIVLQEVVGQKHGDVFYPTFSGVGRSVNFYPIEPEKAEDGTVNVAMGLGKHIVEGSASLRFSPKYPQKILQLSSTDMAVRETQKNFFALDLKSSSFHPAVNDSINIVKLDLKTAEAHGTLRWLGSVYDYNNHMIRDGLMAKGLRLVTFSNVLKYDAFPLAPIIEKVLEIGQKEMNQPVEVEFAVDLQVPQGQPPIFYLLQIRPIVDTKESINENLEEVNPTDTIIYSNSALGNGVIEDIQDVIYVKSENFNPANNTLIAPIIEKLNAPFHASQKPYVLIGPGRWGSQDSWLGVPVKWTQISAARLIVETGLENYRVDPSQGTHFFQNLTSLRVGYFTVTPSIGDGYINTEYLNDLPAVYEDEYVRHVQLPFMSCIKIDGQKGIGLLDFPKGNNDGEDDVQSDFNLQ
ncbi:PEP/pyruvate-binding domain-containing protein [Carboxylicivirga sp. M1479]|uniref:PEP/pyruvate-binding domain-containing protein n=1 Tax=Carboxylicivirga sp. M1479 TaxID=2594476 RepID=UPI0011787109|nr:PEP/pyruvate-binding domain-containing protein [Carboxylicivirga sp. M1479]TRX70831.1 response regulator [Carboxylicivirga sp. M1479]